MTAHGSLEKATKVLWPPSTRDDDMPSFSGGGGGGRQASASDRQSGICSPTTLILEGLMVARSNHYLAVNRIKVSYNKCAINLQTQHSQNVFSKFRSGLALVYSARYVVCGMFRKRPI